MYKPLHMCMVKNLIISSFKIFSWNKFNAKTFVKPEILKKQKEMNNSKTSWS